MTQDYMQVDDGGGKARLIPVNYPPNSRNRRTTGDPPSEERKQEKVVTGNVIQRKKGLGFRFREALLGEKGVDGVVETIIAEILVSALKGMIADAVGRGTDAVNDGFNRFLYGETRKPLSRPGGYYNFNYNRIRGAAPQYNVIGSQARAWHDFDDIVLASRLEAQKVIDGLQELVDQFGVAKVADLYDLVGITSDFPDLKWGWTDLRAARIKPVRGGYLISLPRTQPID